MPAAVLIMAVLGAMSLDQIIQVQAQHQLVVTARTAASQGITAGVDLDELRNTGSLRWNSGLIDQQVRQVVADEAPGATISWTLDGDRLTIKLSRRVRLVFAPSLSRTRVRLVSATATGHLPRR